MDWGRYSRLGPPSAPGLVALYPPAVPGLVVDTFSTRFRRLRSAPLQAEHRAVAATAAAGDEGCPAPPLARPRPANPRLAEGGGAGPGRSGGLARLSQRGRPVPSEPLELIGGRAWLSKSNFYRGLQWDQISCNREGFEP